MFLFDFVTLAVDGLIALVISSMVPFAITGWHANLNTFNAQYANEYLEAFLLSKGLVE